MHNNRNAWLNFRHKKKIGVEPTLVPQFVERSRTNDPLTFSFAVAVAFTLRLMRLSCGDIFNQPTVTDSRASCITRRDSFRFL